MNSQKNHPKSQKRPRTMNNNPIVFGIKILAPDVCIFRGGPRFCLGHGTFSLNSKNGFLEFLIRQFEVIKLSLSTGSEPFRCFYALNRPQHRYISPKVSGIQTSAPPSISITLSSRLWSRAGSSHIEFGNKSIL